MARMVLGIAASVSLCGCGFMHARMPPGFEARSAVLEPEFSWPGFGGARVGNLRLRMLDLGLISGWMGLQDAEYWADRSLELSEGDEARYRVACRSRLDRATLPTVVLTCLFEPLGAEAPPMSLALAATGRAPMRGALLVGEDVWRIDGDNLTWAGGETPDTIGWTVTRAGADAPTLFVDHSFVVPSYRVATDAAPEDVETLAPLMLVWMPMGDIRSRFRSPREGPFFLNPRTDARVLPEPVAPADVSVASERHAWALWMLGEDEAARALWDHVGSALRIAAQ